MLSKKLKKNLLRGLVVIFVLANVMAFFHGRKFTHFDPDTREKPSPEGMPFFKKIKTMFTGVSLPRPYTKKLPNRPYSTVALNSNVRIICWAMKATVPAKGTMILCHGYGGEKSDMLDRAYVCLDAGYNVLLPDFMGAEASEGNLCTIGYKEAENVKTCIDYISTHGEKNIYLLGASMGAAAIMRTCSIYALPVKALVLECPFGSMRQTVKNRFEAMQVPAFPLSDFLVFWGGAQNGFNAFSHNPEDYAKKIKLPVLLLCGGKDDRVKPEEIQHIQGIIQGITKPLTLEESVALARLLGNDYCFGLAWTVIHLIETAPAWDAWPAARAAPACGPGRCGGP
ncbi:MAG: alpha/beta hydrolase, partial [Sphingobacteriales bacterium]